MTETETLRAMLERLKGCRETMSNPWDIVTLWEQNVEALLSEMEKVLDFPSEYLSVWLAVHLPRIKEKRDA